MTTGLIILTLIYFISTEFVSLRRRRLSWPPGETSQAARSYEKRLFSQARRCEEMNLKSTTTNGFNFK